MKRPMTTTESKTIVCVSFMAFVFGIIYLMCKYPSK